jgi:hypothetical protein
MPPCLKSPRWLSNALGFWKKLWGAAHRIVRIAEGADARAVKADGANTFGADIILRVEVRRREGGRGAGQRLIEEAGTGGPRLVVGIIVAAPVEHDVACAERAADLALRLLDHIDGEDRAGAVRRLVQDLAAVDLHDLAGELPRRDLVTGHGPPIAGIGQTTVLRRHHMRWAVELRAGVLVYEQKVGREWTRPVLDVGNDDRLMVLLPAGQYCLCDIETVGVRSTAMPSVSGLYCANAGDERASAALETATSRPDRCNAPDMGVSFRSRPAGCPQLCETEPKRARRALSQARPQRKAKPAAASAQSGRTSRPTVGHP